MIGKVYISDFDINENDIKRFWNLVDIGKETECWNWMGKKTRGGYGRFLLNVSQNFREVYASRVAYKIAHKNLPNTHFVCHTCDNPTCCNPAHLYLGTYTDNCNDKMIRHRHNCGRGETQGSSKLKEYQVLEIRKRVENGETQRSLCKEYNIDDATINHVVKRRSWKHI
jgi:hypothetical protein